MTIKGGLNNHGSVEPENAENAESPLLLRPGVAARKVGVVVRTLADWHRAGKITAQVTAGGQRRYPEHEVIALAAKRVAALFPCAAARTAPEGPADHVR